MQPGATVLAVLQVVAVVYGAIWIGLAAYNLYPLLACHVLGTAEEAYVDASVPADPPTIDVLLPAYEEGNVVHQSIGSIRRADYPQDRITVNVLVEPDDEDTRAALAALADEYEFREITLPEPYCSEVVVPDGYPGLPNKPRALDYGFEVTDGDVVGVIDAEDVVAPDCFRAVAGAIVGEGRDYVQGRLDMVNEADGWTNALFRGEYGLWYRLLLPASHVAGYPVPLGGTTNFVRREVLAAASEHRIETYGSPWTARDREWLAAHGLDGAVPWDPANVTEDFELGLLLWKEGYDLGLLRTATREESPLSVRGWIRQRTRWQKGKLYTFGQYLRVPPSGPTTRLHLLGQAAMPHVGPVNLAGALVLFVLAQAIGFDPTTVAFGALALGASFVVVLSVLQAVGYWRASEATPARRTVRAAANAITLPCYWLLQWVADCRALVQLSREELHWEKTDHHGRNLERGGRVDHEEWADDEEWIETAE